MAAALCPKDLREDPHFLKAPLNFLLPEMDVAKVSPFGTLFCCVSQHTCYAILKIGDGQSNILNVSRLLPCGI